MLNWPKYIQREDVPKSIYQICPLMGISCENPGTLLLLPLANRYALVLLGEAMSQRTLMDKASYLPLSWFSMVVKIAIVMCDTVACDVYNNWSNFLSHYVQEQHLTLRL